MTRLLARLLGRLPIGWLQLTHSRGRLAAALAGVAFADVLVLVQLGIAGALNTTIEGAYDVFEADVIVSAADADTLADGSNVARAWLFRALADPEVEGGTTLFVGALPWSREGGEATLQAYGVDPEASRFLAPDLAGLAPGLALPDAAALDRRTRGLSAEEAAAIGPDAPLRFEARGRTLSVRETFEGGVSFATDGYLLVSDQTFLRLFPDRSSGAPDHVLLRTVRGADPEAVAARLAAVLPAEAVRVRTLGEAAAADVAFQTTERPTGIIFGFGVVIGVLVGVVIVYQVLSTDVADHLSEYATFKAMGYRDRFFLGVVLEEAAILGLLGFVPGVLVAAALHAALGAMTGLPLALGAGTAGAVLAGTVAACALSGAIATRRLAAADPAELF